MPEYENNALIKAIEDKELRKRTLSLVEKILAKRQIIWGFERYREMADHGERHTKNVFDLLTRFLVHSQKHLLEGENKLNGSELFCLIIATWLHDIGGMGVGMEDKKFLDPMKARKEHPFNGGRLVLDDGKTVFLDLEDDEQDAIADIVVSHSSHVKLNNLQPKIVSGDRIETKLLAVLLSLADACDTQESRVGGPDEVELKLHRLELIKKEFEAEIQRIKRQTSPDKVRLARLQEDIEYIGAQPNHHYKHLSVKNMFFTPTSIVLQKRIQTLPEYDEYFDMALSDVQKEFKRVSQFFADYGFKLSEVRPLRDIDDINSLYEQIRPTKEAITIVNFAHPFSQSEEELERILGCRIREVIKIPPAQFDLEHELEAQVDEVIERAGLSSDEWQTIPIMVNIPTYHFAAAIFIANLHGRMGHFPSILYILPVKKAGAPSYIAKSVINLQAVRDKARGGR